MQIAALVLTALPGMPAATARDAAAVARPSAAAAPAPEVSTAAASGVIPLPAHIVTGVGAFNFGPGTVVRVPRGDHDADSAARYLIELWTRTNELRLPVSGDDAGAGASAGIGTTSTAANSISFRRQSGFGPEAYQIEVLPHRITVSATTSAGLFYGAVTLWQLLPPGQGARAIAVQTIRDAPRYRWRGLMLDSVRHFQSPAFVRSMIDWMAWHKLNVLHWHLTDDQGWRLEIRKYPRLASVGAWRTPATAVTERTKRSPASSAAAPAGAARYGGFYTQDQVRGIVAFAATRHVQIVPEIEMPGHAQAAIAAYPALGVRPPPSIAADAARGTPPAAAALAVSAKWGVHTHLFNLEPGTFGFLENVLAEIIELFPSPVIHVGGDEAVKDEWNASPEVQARARQLGIHDPDALQAYFTQKIGRYLAAHGRRLVGWDEILQPGLEKDAIVMSWHGVAGAHAAAIAGNDAILAPWPTLYFDNRQSTLRTEPPGRLNVISLEDVYRFDPHDATLSEAQQRHVLGVEASLWTEHMQTEGRVQWMALPRAAAVAELGWSSPEARNWPGFLERLMPLFARYRAFGLNYADSVFAVDAQMQRNAGGVTLTLSNQAQTDRAWRGAIRYTLDGREPTAASAAYDAPLAVPLGTTVRAAAFVGAEQASRTWVGAADDHAGVRRDSHDLELCGNAIGLLLEPGGGESGAGAMAPPPLAVDIMNPCWIDRGVDLTRSPRMLAAVAPLPFNYEIGADAAKIRVGDARTPDGELEVHVDGCDAPVSERLPLAAAAHHSGVTILPAAQLPRLAGRHDLCLRFARPRLDPMWALDWVEIRE